MSAAQRRFAQEVSDDPYQGADCAYCRKPLEDCENACDESRDAARLRGLDAYTGLGGYPIFYLVAREEHIACATCATLASWGLDSIEGGWVGAREGEQTRVRGDVYWEGEPLDCDWFAQRGLTTSFLAHPLSSEALRVARTAR